MSNVTKPPYPGLTDKTKVRAKFPKKMFTVSEDAMIIRCVSLYGTNNWKLISQFLPGRTIRQLRERYNTYLKPGTLDTPWTPEEDILLSQKVKEYGKHWKAISQFFKGRNQNNIKNRWNFHLKGGEALKNICNITLTDDKHKNNNTNNINNLDNLNQTNNNNSNEINNNEIDYNNNNNIPNNINQDIFIETNNNRINGNIEIDNNNNKIMNSNFFNIKNNNNISIDITENVNKVDNNNNTNRRIIENINKTMQNNQITNQDQDNAIKENLFVVPFLNANQKNIDSNQQISTNPQIANNDLSEVFNEAEFEDFYNNSCSDVFNNFQFDQSINSGQYLEKTQIKKIE